MSNFDEVAVYDIYFGTDAGKMYANGSVTFRSSDPDKAAELIVKISADVGPQETVEAVRIRLAKEATLLLRKVAELPDATLDERIALGCRSFDERIAE